VGYQRAELHPDPAGPFKDAFGALVKRVEGGALALSCRIVRDAESHRGLAGPGRADEERAGAAPQTAAEQRIELIRAAANDLLRESSRVLGRQQAREQLQPARSDRVIVISAAVLDPAHLCHPQPSSLRAIVEPQLLQGDDAMDDAVKLQIMAARRHVVERQHRRLPSRQKLLQRENLAPIA